MRTNRLLNWIKTENEQGNSVPFVCNGGGFGYIHPEDNFFLGDYYHDEVEVLNEDEIYPDFAQFLSAEEMKEMTFVVVRHHNEYNEENCDYQFGTWDLDFNDDDDDDEDEWAGKHEISDVTIWNDHRVDNITYHANGKEITVSGEFYTDKYGWKRHSHIFEDGTEVTFEVRNYNGVDQFRIRSINSNA